MNHHLTFLQFLTALGLATAPESGRTEMDIRKTLGRELAPLFTRRERGPNQTLRDLAERGLVEELPRPPRSRAARWRLLPAGREVLTARLGGAATLEGRGATAKAARLMAMAEALSISPRVADMVLRKRDALLACLLSRHLDEPFDETTTLETLAATVAARALGASNAQIPTLRGALLQRCLAAEGAPLFAKHPPTVSKSNGSELPEDPAAEASPRRGASTAEFLPSVFRAARTAPEEAWFGQGKLFIHRAWEAWRAQSGDTATDLATFKAQLLAALRTGEIGLTRADFTATLDPADLAAAELRDGAETFHFLTAERAPQP